MSVADTAWKGALFAALALVTWLLLTPVPPDPTPRDFAFADKLKHAILFAALALVAARAYADRPRWGIALALVLYGAAIELAQGRTGRSPELLDLVADAIGAAVAFLSPRAAPAGVAKRAKHAKR